jgi:hypothetical protein
MHEMFHAMDAMIANPTICQGKQMGLIVAAMGLQGAKG